MPIGRKTSDIASRNVAECPGLMRAAMAKEGEKAKALIRG
jgi:hypothetical protein